MLQHFSLVIKILFYFIAMRTISVRPNSGPSSGGTLISLLGTAFADTSKQSLRFTFGG